MKPPPIERILVPIHYSEPSFHAAWIALAIARSMQATLTLMHIHRQEQAIREMVSVSGQELEELSDEKFHELLMKIVGDPSAQGLQSVVDHSVVEIETSSFAPSNEICKYAKEHNIDLIVIGSRGRSNFQELVFGSVSLEVVRKAHCPVTIVH
jgi:nucleotide-binding universal stress UspA family protein